MFSLMCFVLGLLLGWFIGMNVSWNEFKMNDEDKEWRKRYRQPLL